MQQGVPTAEVVLDPALVEELIATQAPRWSGLPVRAFGEGWDNALYRLGEDWLVRLPRRIVAVALLENEQRVLAELAPRLPVAVPAAEFLGVPGCGYPWPWAVVPYHGGATLDEVPLARHGVAQWTEFLLALHRPPNPASEPAPPANPYRGVPLAVRADGMRERIGQLRELEIELDTRFAALWDAALGAPASGRATWLHGDPHPRNAIGRDGRLVAVLDWGDVTAGDPAADLASLWMVAHDGAERRAALQTYLARQQAGFAADELDALVLRAKGWALVYGVVHLASGLVNHPAHAAIGRATLRNLGADLVPG